MTGARAAWRDGRGGWRGRGATAGRAPASRGATAPKPSAGRGAAVAWAREMTSDPAVVFLDTETTGLGGTAEVVDLAVVALDGRVVLETLIRPAAAIPPDATAIHGIGDVDVADAPSWPEVHDALCHVLAERPVVVYNAAFDRRMVGQCGARHGLSLPALRWECAMLAYAGYREEANGRGRGYRWHKLEQAVLAFGSRPGGHRAAADALACRAVVIGMAAADSGPPTDDEG